jgi:hypothetical protein
MNHFVIVPAMLTLFAADVAHGEVFKCAAHDGKISFASTPCPSYVGHAIKVQQPAPKRLASEWEEADFAYRVNKNATEILKVSRRKKIIITNEREIAYRLQSIRPPPPGSISTCVPPRYDSACFDPSGGRIRQPVKGSLVRSGAN